jgi:hypothetical protein
MYGDVYCNCPLSGEIVWYDWTSYDDFCKRYGNFDQGRFFWVST